MDKQMKTSKTLPNFGVHGWLLVIYGFFGFMLGGSFWTSSALNKIVPSIAENSGIDSTVLLNGATIAGIIAVPIFLLLGVLFNKLGTRVMLTIILIIPGICVMLLGNSKTYVIYLILMIIINATVNAINLTGLPQVYSNYFPTKKGLIMGYATSGACAGTIIGLPVLVALSNAWGIGGAVIAFGVVMIILGLINAIFIPNTPQEMGKLPDNGAITEEELAALKKENETAEPIWTIKEAVCNKNFWLLAIAYGIMFLLTAGIMMQLVVYEVSQGIEQATAVTLVSVVAILGIFGSAFSGWLDQKLGVKKAGIILGLSFAVACLFGGIIPYSIVSNIAFLAFFGVFQGATSNIPMSHAMSIFGIKSYPKIWAWIMPIIRLIAAFAGSILAYFQTLTGSYRGAYAAFMVLALIAVVLLLFSNQSLSKEPGQKPVVIK